jgi:hypothetical protein
MAVPKSRQVQQKKQPISLVKFRPRTTPVNSTWCKAVRNIGLWGKVIPKLVVLSSFFGPDKVYKPYCLSRDWHLLPTLKQDTLLGYNQKVSYRIYLHSEALTIQAFARQFCNSEYFQFDYVDKLLIRQGVTQLCALSKLVSYSRYLQNQGQLWLVNQPFGYRVRQAWLANSWRGWWNGGLVEGRGQGAGLAPWWERTGLRQVLKYCYPLMCDKTEVWLRKRRDSRLVHIQRISVGFRLRRGEGECHYYRQEHPNRQEIAGTQFIWYRYKDRTLKFDKFSGYLGWRAESRLRRGGLTKSTYSLNTWAWRTIFTRLQDLGTLSVANDQFTIWQLAWYTAFGGFYNRVSTKLR